MALVGVALFLAVHRRSRDVLVPRLRRLWLALALRPLASAAIVVLVPLVLRLALHPWLGIPAACVPDEFSYLLAGDTFAQGRLSNPTPPLAEHFETSFVLVHPTYQSMYPPGQGLALALGQRLTGEPWWGVWLSVGAMLLAAWWMLTAWVPAQWALLGGLVLGLRLGVFGYWMNSYWGGAVAACAGAVVLGAIPRFLRKARIRDGLLLGLGLVLLANSRPFEGFLLASPCALLCLVSLWTRRRTAAEWLCFLGVPLATLALGAAATGAYQQSVTGEAAKLPYEVYRDTYGIQPNLIMQAPVERREIRHMSLRETIDTWGWRYERARDWRRTLPLVLERVGAIWLFFFGTVLSVPFLALPWTLRGRRMRFVWLALGTVLVGLALEVTTRPHYAAPATALFLALFVQGLRHLRASRFLPGALGRRLALAVPLALCLLFVLRIVLAIDGQPVRYWKDPDEPWSLRPDTVRERRKLEGLLEISEDKDLVLIRFLPGPKHVRWVYNEADLEAAPIVWARELEPAENQRLIEHFAGRRVWLCEVDVVPPRLVPYEELAEPQH